MKLGMIRVPVDFIIDLLKESGIKNGPLLPWKMPYDAECISACYCMEDRSISFQLKTKEGCNVKWGSVVPKLTWKLEDE